MFEAVEPLLNEYAEVERASPTPACTPTRGGQAPGPALLRADAGRRGVPRLAVRGRRREAARELAADDASFARRAAQLEAAEQAAAAKLTPLLVPARPGRRPRRDPRGQGREGGEESALFAGDLLRMYLRYAERRGWRTQVLHSAPSDLGGYKDVAVSITRPGQPPAPARASGPG